MLKHIIALAGIAAIGLPGAALAAMDSKQVAIAAKALNFLTSKPPAGARIVVVSGAADLAAVKEALPSATVEAGGPSDTAGAFAAFVGSAADAKSAGAGTVTIGGDVACVDTGACVIAVEVQPKVSIYVSRAAASAAGISFDPNFKMMITEK